MLFCLSFINKQEIGLPNIVFLNFLLYKNKIITKIITKYAKLTKFNGALALHFIFEFLQSI